MASFHRSIDHVDLELQEEQTKETKEYLEIFSRNYKEQVLSLTDCYTESVASFFQFPSTVGTMVTPTPTNGSREVQEEEEIDKALKGLLLSALKLSQALNEKYIQKKQKK